MLAWPITELLVAWTGHGHVWTWSGVDMGYAGHGVGSLGCSWVVLEMVGVDMGWPGQVKVWAGHGLLWQRLG
jgi:hypothetical protein